MRAEATSSGKLGSDRCLSKARWTGDRAFWAPSSSLLASSSRTSISSNSVGSPSTLHD